MKVDFLIAAVAAALVGAAGAESLSFSAETDKDPLSYRVGEEMTFTFTVVDRAAKNAPVKGRRVAWTRTGDDGLAEVGEALSDPTVVVRTKIDRPGFVRLQAHVVDADGKVVPGSGSVDGSAGADVMRIPAKLPPDDFDAFWDFELARLASVPMRPVLEPVDCKDPEVKVSAFSVNLAPGEGPATGLVAWPTNAAAKSLPIRVDVPGYGYGRSSIAPRSVKEKGGCIRICITRYGEDPVAPDDYHMNLWTNVHQGFCWRNNTGITANDPYRMLLRDARAVAFAKTLAQWNGREITVGGGSMGGYRSVALAALDPDVTSCSPSFTWFADLAGHLLFGRIAGWLPKWTPELSYVDAANLASRVTCPVSVHFGLGDYVCPPSGQMIMVRNFRGSVELSCSQNVGHGCGYGVNSPNYKRSYPAKGDDGLDRYGASKAGQKLEATGRFRVETVGGVRWLIDPEGLPYRDLAKPAVPRDPTASARRTPYVRRIHSDTRTLGGGPKDAPRDPFDGSFGESINWDIAGHHGVEHDPWCIGFVLDETPDWGTCAADLARWALGSTADQPARIEFLKRLAKKGISYDAAKGPDSVPVEELTAFGNEIAKEYFRRAREGVRKLDAKLLFLGCGFKGAVPAHVERFALEFCDCLY